MDREPLKPDVESNSVWPVPAAARWFAVVSALILLASAGCTVSGPFTRNDFGPSLPANASVEEVTRRVNMNIERLQAWRSDDVRISGRGMPIHLGGHILVERPRNFRLTAGILGMDEEADFGSNNEWFWFWIKRGQPSGQQSYVYQARHEDVANSDMLSKIPFQPDWIMEALGIVPIDSQHVTLHPEPRGGIVNLISERLSPSGQTVKKVIRVDTQRGLVLSHSLHDVNGNLIARARMDNHRQDKSTKIVMPHMIVLEWPQAELQITLEIGQIDVNPTTIPPRNWEVPKKPYYPAFDLGAASRKRVQPASGTAVDRGRVENIPTDGRQPGSTPDAPPEGFGAPSPIARPSVSSAGRASLNDGNVDWEKPIEGQPSSPASQRTAGNPFDAEDGARAPSAMPSSGASRGSTASDPFGGQNVGGTSQPAKRQAAAGNDPFEDLSR